MTNDMINLDIISEELKVQYPNFKDRLDKVLPIAKEIISSKIPSDTLSTIVPTLDCMDAYVLGMVMAKAHAQYPLLLINYINK